MTDKEIESSPAFPENVKRLEQSLHLLIDGVLVIVRWLFKSPRTTQQK